MQVKQSTKIVFIIFFSLFENRSEAYKEQKSPFKRMLSMVGHFKKVSQNKKMIDYVLTGTILKQLVFKKMELARRIKDKSKRELEYKYIEKTIYDGVDTLLHAHNLTPNAITLQDIDALMEQAQEIESNRFKLNPSRYVISAERIETCKRIRTVRGY